jgi:hypothetical protein
MELTWKFFLLPSENDEPIKIYAHSCSVFGLLSSFSYPESYRRQHFDKLICICPQVFAESLLS